MSLKQILAEIQRSFLMRPRKLEPLLFRDPTDDGPEVDILRKGKTIIHHGDGETTLAYVNPRVSNRYS